MRRVVAWYANACNVFPTPEMRRKLEVLRQRCEGEGRDVLPPIADL